MILRRKTGNVIHSPLFSVTSQKPLGKHFTRELYPSSDVGQFSPSLTLRFSVFITEVICLYYCNEHRALHMLWHSLAGCGGSLL
jgi:hypothetical protein